MRADGHPLHRLGRRHAVDRARQGAVEARPAAARDPDRRVPGDGDRARAPVAQAEVPADRQAQPRRVVQRGSARMPRSSTTRRPCARSFASSSSATDQPALIEAYISGREFTVGLLGDRRPRVLPPMEIIFKDKGQSAAGLRLPDQAGVGEARRLPVPRRPDAGRNEGGRAGRARDLRGARLPRRRARRPAHDRQGRDLRHRGEPAAGADARDTPTCVSSRPRPASTTGR